MHGLVIFVATVLSAQAVLAQGGQLQFVLPIADEDAWQTISPSDTVHSVLGKEVRNATGENLGRIVDVLIDQNGHVQAVVIDFGGFLGVGARMDGIAPRSRYHHSGYYP